MRPSFRLQLFEQSAPVTQSALFDVTPPPKPEPVCPHPANRRIPQRDLFAPGEIELCGVCNGRVPR